ncbi:peroxidase-like isoform X2 [Battus philenor]|uniref:peroxidase-like isoform X2 n=1 Tax=Battus philenor TaxID=42288 RepID=UPI0035CF5044
MLFKRIIEGKSMLKPDVKEKSPEKCSRRKSECDGCGEHFTILEEMTKMVLLGVVLWAGVSFGIHVAPYPLNLIVTTDIVHPPPMYDFPFPSAEMLKRLPPVTSAYTNKSIGFSKMTVELLERFENNLQGAMITPKQGTAAQAFAIQGRPSNEAMHYEKSSTIITKASQNLIWTRCTRYGLAMDECASFISTLNLRDTEYGAECAALERFTCRTNKMSSKYRTFDGSCNNPVRSSWGQALTGFKRLLHPRYADGIEEPRKSVYPKQLPSARVISMKLTDNMDKPDSKKTIALAVWSQFIHHDLVHIPVKKTLHTKEAIRCCGLAGNNLTPRYVHPSCMPISVPSDDPIFTGGGKKSDVTCMEYTRSVTTYRGDCTFGAAEQMNQATHFLDGSLIYGSNSRDAAALREKHGGLLKTSDIGSDEHLPLAATPTDKCLVESDEDVCFNTGDIRSNMHPWLTGVHSLWVKEHNRIARTLSNLNPHWNSDRLYHEARRIVVAELQHITYKQWLPALTGKVFDEFFDSYDTGYNSDIDPTITNSFATAAFHFVNSLYDNDIELVDEDNKVLHSERLKENYFKPNLVASSGGLDKILRGMVTQKSQDLDLNYDDDLRHHWLGGLDVLAIDIQRGRDHGLPGYVQYRTLCGLSQATDFHDLIDVIPHETVNKLSKMYDHPVDIDLVVGMMAEQPLPGSLLGPTASCLIKEQLWRTRSGDRYFYTHQDEAGGFSKRQLTELKRASLARLLCDNVAIKQIQKDVFQSPSDSNPLVSCEEIRKVNLEAWQDPSHQPDILTRTNKWLKNKVGSVGNSTK